MPQSESEYWGGIANDYLGNTSTAAGSGGGFSWGKAMNVAGNALNIGSSVYGIYSNLQAQKKTYQTNKRVNELLKEQLSKIPGMEETVNRLYSSNVEALGLEESREMYKLGQTAEANLGRSGFEQSGALNLQKRVGENTIYDEFEKRRLSVLEQREAQLGQLAEQRSMLETQQASLDLSNPTRDLDTFMKEGKIYGSGSAAVSKVSAEYKRRAYGY